MSEILREFPVEEYKKLYKVSNQGKIRSNYRKKYLVTICSAGYEVFTILNSVTGKRVQFRVDIIVASAFLGKSDLYLEHVDGNLRNNNLSNLRWIEYTEYLKKKYGSEWTSIKGYEKYFVSKDGRVWSSYIQDFVSQQLIAGYYALNIGYPKKMFKHVHRLVAMNFLENPDNLPVVNHIDRNKFNNNVENLEWMTVLQNNIHSIPFRNTKSVKNQKVELTEFSVELHWLLGYAIFADGRVYSMKSCCFLKPLLNDNGYYRTNVYIDGKSHKLYVHRLVAQAYLDLPLPGQTQVNHKNMIRTDNRVENLEWMSASDNVKHSIVNNPEQYKHLQKKVARIDPETGNVIDTFNGIKEASRITSVNSGSIVKVCKEIKKTAGGFMWKYVD